MCLTGQKENWDVVNGCSGGPERSSVARPDPEGANNYLPGQLPHRQVSSPKAYDNDALDEDEKFGLLEADKDVGLAEVGLQPSETHLAPQSLLPAIEEMPEQPLIVAASASMGKMSSDTPLSPSETSLASQTQQRLLTDTEDTLYPDTDRDFPLTKLAIKKLQKNRLLRQRTDTSSDDDRRKSLVDSGKRFPAVLRKSVSPGSDVTVDTYSPAISSTSTFLFDSESSDSDVGVVRTLTLRSIAKMKRKKSRRSTPNVRVAKAELAKPEPLDHISTQMSARAPTRSRSPQTQSSIDKAKSAWGSPVVSDVTPIPATPSPASASEHAVEVEPGSQSAALSRAATPTSHILPGSSTGQTTPVATQLTTPVTQHTSPASQAPPPDQQPAQPVQVAVDSMKDVQKMERTDAEGRKTTVYKLTPKAGTMFAAPVWPGFAAPSNLRLTSLDQSPAAGIRVDQSGDTTGARLSDMRRSTAADQQSIDRLKSLARQRGENVKPAVLQEIQGVSARAQVRSAGQAQVTALQQPLTVASADDVFAPAQYSLPSSVQDRLSYAPFTGSQTTADQFHWSASDFQLSDDNGDGGGLVERLMNTDSLSKFPYLSGERSHTELAQRIDVDVTVSDATSATNIATSQFLRDRFNSQKKCFKGLIESSPQAYLSGVSYEDLQPETQSLLSRLSAAKPAARQSELQRIRSSFLSDSYHQQHLSEARPDYPQQPSSSQLEHRLSFVPSDAARPDEALHPSVSRIAAKPADTSRPDDFLHPSLHRISAMTPTPARHDDALHPSLTRLNQIAKYDDALHPSLSRLQTKEAAQASQVPAKLDDHLHPSLTRVQLKPSASGRLVTDLEKTTTTTTVVDKEYFLFDEPSTPDEYLHPSSTRIVSSDSTKSELTKRTPSARDAGRTQLQSAVPAKPDDSIQPSSTRLPTQDRSKITGRDDVTRRSSASLQRTASLDKKETLPPPVPARTDDILHPSATQFKQRTSALDRATSTTAVDRKETVPARTDDMLHPSSTQFSQRFSARGTLDSATSTTSVERKDVLPQVPARTDDVVHPSSTQFSQRLSTRSTLDSATSTTAVDRKETVPARTDDVLHPSSTQFQSRASARGTLDSATSTTSVDRSETLPPVPARTDDILHPSSTQLQSQVSTRAALDSATSTTGSSVDRKVILPSGPDDVNRPYTRQVSARESFEAGTTFDAARSGGTDTFPSTSARTSGVSHPSSSQVSARDRAAATLDSAAATTTFSRDEGSAFASARPDDVIHPHSSPSVLRQRDGAALDRSESVHHSSARMPQSDAARVALDTADSTGPTGRQETFQSESARLDDTTRRSSTHILPRRSGTASLTTATDRRESWQESARYGDIGRASAAQLPSQDSVRDALDTTTSGTAVDKKETLTSVTTESADQDDITYPSFARESARAGSAFDTDISAATLPLDAFAVSDDLTLPFPPQLSYRGSSQSTPETSDRAVRLKETSPSVTARPDDVSQHSSRTQFTSRDGGRTGVSFETATSTTGLGENDVLPPVSARPDDILHPSSTQFRPSQSTRATTHSATTSATDLGREETQSSVPARPDDIIHPSATQFSRRDSTRRALDTATSTAGLGRMETFPSEHTRPDDAMHPFDRRPSESRQSAMDSATSTTALGRHENILPLVPARPDDITHFRQRGSTRDTLDAGTSTVGLTRKDAFLSVPARPDELMHPSSTQFQPRESTRGSMDLATSTTVLGRRDSILPLVTARPDDVAHPSLTQLPRRDSTPATFDTSTSTTGFDSEGRLGDMQHPPVTDSTRRSYDRHDDWEASQSRAWMEDSVPATDGSEAVRTSVRSGSDLQLSENQFTERPSEGYEPLYPSEFVHPPLTDRATSGSAGRRPSSLRIPDQDDAFASRSRSTVDIAPQGYARDTRAETAAEDGRTDRQSVAVTDEKLPSEVRRSSVQRPRALSALATVPETSGDKVDLSRQRRTVTWDLGPRAKSDVDASLADSLPSVGQRSLPDIQQAGSPSRTSMSGTSARSTDWSHETLSVDGRRSTASDLTTTNYINARDSRIVTREHIMKKQQLEDSAAAAAAARADEYSPDAADERRQELQLVASTAEDEPTQRASGSSQRLYPSSHDRASALRVSDAAAAAADDDDVSLQQRLDSSSLSDFHQFAEVEDWLLASPRASVSRPPCSVQDCRRVDRGMNTDAECRRQSSGYDVTRSPTHRDMAVDSRTQLTPASQAAHTSRDPCREPLAVSRMFAGRDCSCSRPADVPALRTTRYDRGYCTPNVGNYRSPFARGFVPSTPSRTRGSAAHGQPCPTCQSSRQPPSTQQV